MSDQPIAVAVQDLRMIVHGTDDDIVEKLEVACGEGIGSE